TSSGGSTTTWSGGPAGNTTNGCATASAVRWSYWPGPPGGLPGCSRTGGSAHVLTAGQWEPDESRGSSPVLREPGGAIPPGHSPRGLGPRRQRPRAGDTRGRRPSAGTDGIAAVSSQNLGGAHERRVRLPGVPHPMAPQARHEQVVRLHLHRPAADPVAESKGPGAEPQDITTGPEIRADQAQPGHARVGQLLPARRSETHLQ